MTRASGRSDVSEMTLRSTGLVGGTQQGFKVGEGIKATLVFFAFAQLARSMFCTFEIVFGQFVEKTTRFTMLQFAEFLSCLCIAEC